MGKLKSILCSENFPTESLIVASLKDSRIVQKGTLIESQNLTIHSKIDDGSFEAFAGWNFLPGYH